MAINYGANYTGIDKERYDAGNQFYSQDRFLQGTGLDKPAITFNPSQSNTGIMSNYNPYPIIPMYDSGGDGGGPPPGPKGNSKFDYEYEALGGLNNPNNVPLTEEEEKTLNMQKAKDIAKMAGKLGMFALNPMGYLMGQGISKGLGFLKDKFFGGDGRTQANKDANTGYTNRGTKIDFGDYYNDDGSDNTSSSMSTENSVGPTSDFGMAARAAEGGLIGRANYRDGGLTKYEVIKLGELGYNTKGGTILEPFGGIKVLRDILRVNKYAYGGIVGMYR